MFTSALSTNNSVSFSAWAWGMLNLALNVVATWALSSIVRPCAAPYRLLKFLSPTILLTSGFISGISTGTSEIHTVKVVSFLPFRASTMLTTLAVPAATELRYAVAACTSPGPLAEKASGSVISSLATMYFSAPTCRVNASSEATT